MSGSDASDQRKTLKRKAVEIEFERVTRPDPTVDILKMFKTSTRPIFDVSNQWTIDVFPNMIPIIMYIMLTSNRHYNLVANRDFSKISASTLCIYNLCMVYGFFLINDLEVRSKPSVHARHWKNDASKMEFVTTLRSLPVPEFIATLLSQFHACETDRTSNVFFVPSAAGYDHNQFFGRVFPINFFSVIHDCIATLSSSSSINQILQNVFTRPLYTIGEDFTCIIPDLIGISIDRTTATTLNYMNSKLYQIFNTLFNPVLFRDVQRRPTLAALSLEAPSYDSAHINAYDYMFAATEMNLTELQVVLNAVAAVLPPQIPMSGRLDDFIKNSSGTNILMHGYSPYALPTWSHSEETAKINSFNTMNLMHQMSPVDRARDFSFLQRPAAAITTTHDVVDVTYVATEAPTVPVALPTGYSLVRHFPGSLRLNQNGAQPFPRHDNESLVQFSAREHMHPQVLVLDTDGTQGINAYLATLTGKVIESFELDGTTVEVPRNDRTLGGQNAQFADSAIPYKYVRPGSDYHPRPANEIMPPLNRRLAVPSSRQTASSLLYCRMLNMLPHFRNQIHEELGATLPGMSEIRDVVSARYTQSMIGFYCNDGSGNAATNDEVPAMSEGRLLVWSPYTYTPYERFDWPTADLSQSRHYYLTNLRTLFGTDFNLVQVRHAYEALPVV